MKQLPPDTPEQSLITQYKGPRLVVKAYAGTGKTTTLVKYAHNNLDSRILYLAYNRAIRDEAREKFPANVDCKTSHQLAYATIGRGYQHKLSGNLRLTDIAEPRQPGGCKLKTAPVRPVVAARPAEYVCSEDLFY